MSSCVLPSPALAGLHVFERGWLSSNNVLIPGADGEGAVLLDSGHSVHAAQTLALVRHALGGQPLVRVINTHLHSDHCGGNAALQREFGAEAHVPPGSWDAVQAWDEERLSYAPTGQRCERFRAHGRVEPGRTLALGGRHWEVLAAPGHDPDSVMLFDALHGVLVSADALWENGFGVVFPELEGERAFDDVAAVLELIARLPVAVVIPGHGAPFTDVAAALARARARLDAFRASPARHARHGAKVLLKYHLMEEQAQPLAELRRWAGATPLLGTIWQRHAARGEGFDAWFGALLRELCEGGALALHDDGVVRNA
ncbi:MBL fold metallo-hydrolase [Caldimonas tepidiphila]|uniref:MBL fold metallo-hydrolase n=1 Tax=Caldimonas tepidiphila TaxID=2315841 RepID=UPI000E5A9458|nr:MBL fold metallo-hydrolase [Caldimonas tepidiphila]